MADRFDRLAQKVDELAEEVRFLRNLDALARFAERPREIYTIGSQLYAPRPNPHYRPPTDVPVIPQQRRPHIGELIGDSYRTKAARDAARRTP